MFAQDIAFSVVVGLLVAINLLGNGLVILLVKKTRAHARAPMDYLLVNLAAADMAVGALIMLIFYLRFAGLGSTGGDIVCKTEAIANIGFSCSAFTLVVIAFERYHAIMFPCSRKGRMTKKKLKYSICGSWAGATMLTMLSLPNTMHMTYQETASPSLKCAADQATIPWPWYEYFYAFLWLLAAGIFPVICMIILYSKIVFKMWFQRPAAHAADATQFAVTKYRKRATQLMLTVSVTYIVCWIPGLVINTLAVSKPGLKGNAIHVVSVLFVILNSSANPVIYTLQNQRFRRQLIRLLGCGSRVNQSEQHTEDNGTPNSRGGSRVV